MLTLDTIEMREIRLPLKQPFRTASGVQDSRRILLLELTARAGETAWSECVAQETPRYSPETIDTAWLAIREWFVPALKGRAIADPLDVLARLAGVSRAPDGESRTGNGVLEPQGAAGKDLARRLARRRPSPRSRRDRPRHAAGRAPARGTRTGIVWRKAIGM